MSQADRASEQGERLPGEEEATAEIEADLQDLMNDPPLEEGERSGHPEGVPEPPGGSEER